MRLACGRGFLLRAVVKAANHDVACSDAMEAPGRRVTFPCHLVRQADDQLVHQGVLHLKSSPVVPRHHAAAVWREVHGQYVGAAGVQLASDCHGREDTLPPSDGMSGISATKSRK